MDPIGLVALEADVAADVGVAVEAAGLAALRFAEGSDSGRESCAFQLMRLFNVVEQMGLRIATAFENHIDDERGWHAELIQRLSIAMPGIRPALYAPELLASLRDLRGFRHVISHAYDLQLDADRLALVLRHARRLAEALPALTTAFFRAVQEQEKES